MNKPKFNLMDGFIIIILILIIGAGVFLLSGKKDATPTGEVQNSIAEYKIELAKYDKAVADAFLLALENGETAWVSEKERFEAKIIDVEVLPSKKAVVNEYTKTAGYAGDPTAFDIIVSLESPVIETDASITASGNILAVGEKVSIRSKSAAGNGYIVGLDIKD